MIKLSREAICPECGESLSVSVEKIRKTGEIRVVLFCEGDGDDAFELEILTGLKNKDIGTSLKVGKMAKKEMKIKLVQREPAPSY